MKKKDEFGSRMKYYEKMTDSVLDISRPICIRIDGKKFSKFTSGMKKPFDDVMIELMQKVTKKLHEEFRPSLSYCQSDEITLVFFENIAKNIVFGGRIQKLVSVVAGKATSYFMNYLSQSMYSDYCDKFPSFDARAWNVPHDIEALNVILWRVQDSYKNSISCTFRWTFGHKKMQNLSGKQMIEEMKSQGFDFDSRISDVKKYGSIFKRVVFEQEMGYDLGENRSHDSVLRSRIDMFTGKDFKENKKRFMDNDI